MKVKKYTASTLPEAMKLVKADLGSGAVILNTREIQKGGFLGFFTKTAMEVFAALDNDGRERIHKPIERNSRNSPAASPSLDAKVLADEIRQLKGLVSAMKSKSDAADVPVPLKEWEEYLVSQELSPELIQELMNSMSGKWNSFSDQEQEAYDWSRWMSDWLAARMQKSEFGPFNYETKFLNVVGPTGVGKTTTLAKIAAKAVLKDGKRAAFITTDTYRIAAIEQLKTYAEILNIPCEVAYTADDFKRAKEKLADYDVVFVDSAGRNFLNPFYVEELQRIIQFDSDMKNYLVLSLVSRFADMDAIYKRFQNLPVHKVIFTKKDETVSYGAMINFSIFHKIGTAYVTDGQNVPDDLIDGDADKITARFLEGKKNG
ncbi:flagellar biosynthesis protein FlhF [Fictibacillus aquaticus]|uniref:Flagellar biosynthesis protein FlhF n=1 Tax=Fictibacillus aquaticus TaxID=2021314 RepID=A0A235FBS9_9BACL|nr:flagellar biosynthesis protein FlhF [Fictibacillus aquaticus]OYD58840.1 flagellar biosynthesis protein FlhF [Fictibacillus aquaticus]